MKKRKIKWKNVLAFALLIGSIAMILHQFYILVIYPVLTGHLTGLTYTGLLVMILVILIANWSFETLRDDFN